MGIFFSETLLIIKYLKETRYCQKQFNGLGLGPKQSRGLKFIIKQEKCPDTRAGLIAAKNTQTATKNVT